MKGSLFELLYACVDNGPHSQKEICDEWHIPRSTLNTTVIQQVAAGNVMLVPRGNKQKDVCLTEQGKALAELMLGSLLDAEDHIAGLCVDDGLIAGIEKLADETEHTIGGLA
ncbi:MAG: MarR family winged helix-turn-helix transcriptional regulator [Atopobiaceae bacterium]|nr:MarR family winged helix-turn-helix transcriptional regulator [Atopobiaceae bacterium]